MGGSGKVASCSKGPSLIRQSQIRTAFSCSPAYLVRLRMIGGSPQQMDASGVFSFPSKKCMWMGA